MSERRVKRLDELARDVPPARDLWPAIAAAMAADRAETRTADAGARRRSFWRPTSAVAAAMALVAIGVVVGMQFGSTTVVVPLARNEAAAEVMPASLREAEYRRERSALIADVQKRLEAMPAGEREKVAASLATLRRSIAEIEAAMGRDPANALLQELFVSSCQEEMRVLTAVRDAGSQEI